MGTIIPNMGTNKNSVTLGEALFSKTQRQVLGLLFGTPERSFYLNEIVRIAGVGIGTVQRELEKLSGVGLLTVEKIGNQKHYQANRKAPIYDELRGLVVKTFGLADVLRKALEPCQEKISVAFIYGSQASGTDGASSDIDVMILAEQLSYPELLSALSGIDSKLGRPVNPSIYQPEEFKTKLQEQNNFLLQVMERPKIFLRGTEDDFRES